MYAVNVDGPSRGSSHCLVGSARARRVLLRKTAGGGTSSDRGTRFVMAAKLFIRRRDGRIEVRLNDAGRDAIREVFAHVVASERDPDHDWHLSMNAPINPSDDHDDPLATLARQHDIASNAELSVMTLKEQFLNEAEAWAWLCTLQVALRATA